MQGWPLLVVIFLALDAGFIFGGWLRGVLEDRSNCCRHCRDWPTCPTTTKIGD